MRKVDKLGRIVIPRSLREKYGLTEGSDIEFLDDGDGIIIKLGELFCRLCRSEIPCDTSLPLCESCITSVVKNIMKKHENKKNVFIYIVKYFDFH